jgi:hypothetical protein
MTKRVIRKRIRHRSGGLDINADLNAVIAINHGDGNETTDDGSAGRRTTARATQSAPIIQTSGRRHANQEDS